MKNMVSCNTASKVTMLHQIRAVPNLCYFLTQRPVEMVGGVFDPVVSSCTHMLMYVKGEFAKKTFLPGKKKGRFCPLLPIGLLPGQFFCPQGSRSLSLQAS